MNNIYSFYQLISKYQIEIPIIQRDYAQGRNNVKAADVRKSLVKKMIDAVDDNGKDLFFDFVYGRVDDNKFIPFDGQQRLTTLFLFHKYIFEKCQSVSECSHTDKCICKELLGRFSYATRQSSREFCEKLVENNVIPGQDEEKLSEHIKDQSWFYSDWEKDPTVMGMLTMLDEIHNQIKGRENTDFKSFAEKLTSGCNCPITFHYVDMGEHKLSDETYVKMNARGKQLTPFENFKASLEQYLENKSDISSDWLVSIDGKWLDMFFNVENEGGGEELPDSLMLSFFNRHFMNVWQCCYAKGIKNDKDDELEKFDKRIQKELLLYPSKDDFIPFEIYRYVMDNCGVEICLSPIFNIWDALCKEGNNIPTDCQAVWNRKENKEKWDLYQKEKNESYKSHAAFYALLMYYKKIKEIEKPTLSQWMRVAWNIIENYVEGEDSYINTLVLIDTIANKNFRINELKQDEYKVAKDQVTEEIKKAKQILNGDPRNDGKTWEEVIIDAESYAFFKGAIRFLFQNGEGGVCWENFDKKWKNAKTYFKEEPKDFNLLKKLISCVSVFKDMKKIYYDNYHWRNGVLLNSSLYECVNNFLLGNLNKEHEGWDFAQKFVFNDLVEKDILEGILPNCQLEEYGRGYRLWIKGIGNGQQWKKYLIGCVRNEILSELYGGKICESNKDESKIYTGQKNDKGSFFWGEHVDFKYKGHFFQWYGSPNEKELDVYLMEIMENERTDYKKRSNPTNGKGTDEDNYYCFRVSSEMVENTTLFTDELNKLIEQVNSDNKSEQE